jgi:hypothetical protein
MQKAHLYEAISLLNHGMDEAVRGLERLKKAPGVAEEMYRGTVTTLEHTRAQVNLRFPRRHGTSRKARCRAL